MFALRGKEALPSNINQDWGTHSTRRWAATRTLFPVLEFGLYQIPNASVEVTVYDSERWNSWGQVWEGDLIGGGKGEERRGRRKRWGEEAWRQPLKKLLKNWLMTENMRGTCRLKMDGLRQVHLTPEHLHKCFFEREMTMNLMLLLQLDYKWAPAIRVFTLLRICRKEEVASISALTQCTSYWAN